MLAGPAPRTSLRSLGQFNDEDNDGTPADSFQSHTDVTASKGDNSKMEKEGRVTPAEPTCHSARRTESAERQRGGTNRHVIPPDLPRLSQRRPKGKHSGGGLKWSPPSDVIGLDLSWSAKSFQPPSATTKSDDPRAQSRIAADDSADAQRRATGWRRSGSTPTPARADLAQFEVKMSDFPQLDAGPSRAHKESRGPKVTAERRRPASESNSPRPDVRQQKAAGGSRILPDSRQSDDGAANQPAPATLWANVASQPPKKSPWMPKETAARQPEEATAAGRKKRKKKKAAKEGDDGAEAERSTVRQEPPKFEDEEEFPDLAPAPTRSARPASGRMTESQQDAAQTPPSEAAKKGQKICGKKSKAPVQLDIGNMLSVLEDKHKAQKVKHNVVAVGGGLPVIHKQPAVHKRTPRQQDKMAHNPLDSTSPLVKKGKQREVPKAKKPTALKKVILKEREERKQRRLLEEKAPTPQRDCAAELTAEAAGAVLAGDERQPNESGEERSARAHAEERSARAHADERRSPLPDSAVAVPDGPKIHSRKFREYCSQMLSQDVDQCASSLLKELVRFQDRLYQKDPAKARMKRRVVMGLREVLKHLKLHKVKCVIISPNCERVQSKGGLDEALHQIIETCRRQEVPFVFALSRRALGRCVNKMVPVSLVGIFNYDGAQDYYHQMIELSSEARRAYEEMLASAERAALDLSEERASAEPARRAALDSRRPGCGPLRRKPLEEESGDLLNLDAWPNEDEEDQT